MIKDLIPSLKAHQIILQTLLAGGWTSVKRKNKQNTVQTRLLCKVTDRIIYSLAFNAVCHENLEFSLRYFQILVIVPSFFLPVAHSVTLASAGSYNQAATGRLPGHMISVTIVIIVLV